MKTTLAQQKNWFLLDSVAAPADVKYHLLCVHGLNQNPESMKPLFRDLAQQGIACHLLHLPGHLPDDRLNHRVTKDIILGAYRQAYFKVQEMAKVQGVSMGLLGYSFGGLIAASMAEELPFNKMVLLAPALKLKPYTHGLRPLLPMLSRVFSVPLGDRRFEERYRFHHRGVPGAVYRSFFEIYDGFQKQDRRRMDHYKAVVFAHPRDELVSYRRLRRFINRLENWDLKRLSNRHADFGRYKHLIFDETTLGQESYRYLLKETLNFLLADDQREPQKSPESRVAEKR